VTTSPRKPAEHGTSRSSAPFVPPQPSEEDLLELREPYDVEGPEYPEHWLPGLPRRPEYVFVIAQHPDLRPGHPPSLIECLGTRLIGGHDPEPDLEAEP